MVTVALPHAVQVRLMLPFVSVTAVLVAVMPEAVIAPLVSVMVRLVALILEI